MGLKWTGANGLVWSFNGGAYYKESLVIDSSSTLTSNPIVQWSEWTDIVGKCSDSIGFGKTLPKRFRTCQRTGGEQMFACSGMWTETHVSYGQKKFS